MLYTQGKETMESRVGGLMARPGVVYITVPSSSHWWDWIGLQPKEGKQRNSLLCGQEEESKQAFLSSTHALSARGSHLFYVCVSQLFVKWYMGTPLNWTSVFNLTLQKTLCRSHEKQTHEYTPNTSHGNTFGIVKI